MFQEITPQDFGNVSHTHRGTRVTGSGFLYCVHATSARIALASSLREEHSDSRSDDEGHALNDLTTARFGLRRKICQQFTASRASCTWNILLPLQKSLDHAACCAIYSPVRCAFPYTETERRFTCKRRIFNNPDLVRKKKNENSRLIGSNQRGNGTDRLPDDPSCSSGAEAFQAYSLSDAQVKTLSDLVRHVRRWTARRRLRQPIANTLNV